MRADRLAVAALVALLPSGGAACGEPAPAALRADPEIQARIAGAAAAIVRQDPAAAERFDDLRAAGEGDRIALLRNLALFLSEARGTEQSMAAALLVDRLEFTPDEKLDAVLPHLDAADTDLRRVLGELLGTIDRPDGGDPDFGPYESRLRGRRDDPPVALVRYMYEVSPEVALASLTRIHAAGAATPPRPLRDLQGLLADRDGNAPWSAAERERAVADLEALARDPAWWVRLYAAAVVARDPDLETPQLAARLAADPHPLVRGSSRPAPSPAAGPP
jgi:hypothetical protein